jgi:hypothetical protein
MEIYVLYDESNLYYINCLEVVIVGTSCVVEHQKKSLENRPPTYIAPLAARNSPSPARGRKLEEKNCRSIPHRSRPSLHSLHGDLL